MINRYPSLNSEVLFKRSSQNNFLNLIEENHILSYEFFDFGTSALFQTINRLGLKAGDHVLMPAYICRIVDELFRHFGIVTGFYKVRPDLSIDLKDLQNNINSRTAAILIVHYFGFPQISLPEIKLFCQKNKLFLIEDNAHSFLSMKDKNLLGTRGDIGFSSIWKSYPVKNGAILYINNRRILPENHPTNSPNRIKQLRFDDFKYIISSLLTTFEYKINYSFKERFKASNKITNSTRNRIKFDFNLHDSRISRMTIKTIKKIDIETVIKQRRSNYHFWADYLRNIKGIQYLSKDLPTGVCPQIFPLIVESPDTFMHGIIQKGIHAYNWPPLPAIIKNNKNYRLENHLSKHLIALPVHQNIDSSKLKRILS